MITIKVNKNNLENLEKTYLNYIVERNIGYILFVAKTDKNIITAYDNKKGNNFKVTIQGENAHEIAEKWTNSPATLPKKTKDYSGPICYLDIDEQVVSSLIKYKAFNKSPYSNSFYNSNDIDWGHKPEGSIRISDHWGFESLGEKHCVIDFEDLTDEDEQEQLNMSWLVCVYRNGKYHIIEKI